MKYQTQLIRIAAAFILFVLLAATILPSSAQTIRRVTTAGDSAADGSTWAVAMNLQAALAASDSLDQVWIAGGIYKPHATDRRTTFSVSAGVLVYGGFDPAAGSAINNRTGGATILSGDLMGDDITRESDSYASTRDDNSNTVVTITGVNVTLDGLTITAGQGVGFSSSATSRGAGLYAGPGITGTTLTACTFTGNETDGSGGGAYFGGTATLTACTFTGNVTGSGGGGAFFFDITTLTACAFMANEAYGNGGGAYFEVAATLTACTFTGNETSEGSGGGAWCGGVATLTNCVLTGNRGKGSGGGLFLGGFNGGTVINSTLYNNSAGRGGGGLYVVNFSFPFILQNSILVGNTATNDGDQVYVGTRDPADVATLQNNLIAGGADPMGTDQGVVYNIPGSGNITQTGTVDATAAAVFASTTSSNANYLRLRAGSPAVNAGNNDYLNNGTPSNTEDDIKTDAAGAARIQNGVVDLGAYESDLKAAQIIAFSSDDAGDVGTDIELMATASSTLPVTFAITGEFEADGTTRATDGTVATLADGSSTLILTGVGMVDITATQAGNTNYADTMQTQTITVSQGTQTITFTSDTTGNVGTDIELMATASSTLPVTFAITGEFEADGTTRATDGTVATLADGSSTLILTGVGMVDITATQAGNTNYADTMQTQTITVSQGTQTVAITSTNTGQATTTTIALMATVVNASGVATGSAITYEIEREMPTTPGDNVADLSAGTNMLELIRPGTVEIKATAAGDVNTYGEASDTQVITVTADPVFVQTLIFNLAAGGMSGDEITLTATSQDVDGNEITGLSPVMFAIASGSNSPTTAGKTVATLAADVLTLASPGMISITASREAGRGDDGRSYGAATAVTQEITVSAAMQTLMFDLVADGTSGDVIPLRSTAQNAGGNDITAAVGLPAITYTSSDERVAMVRAAGGGGQELLLKAPGTVTITALRGGGTVGGVTYAVAADVTQDIIVESATQTITFTPLANAGQVGEAINLTATVNSGMEVTLAITAEERPAGTAIADGTVATLDAGTGVLTFVGVGNVTVTASQTGGTTAGVTYTGATNVTQTFTVTQGTQTVAITSTNTGQATTTTIALMATVVNASGVATGSAITYEIERETPTTFGDNVADLSAGTNMLELIRPGTVEIKATAAGDVNTYGEASDTLVITVTADPVFVQTLIFNLAADGMSGDEITLTATSQDAGGTEITGLSDIVYAIASGSNSPTTTGDVATLAADVLTLASPGMISITASREAGRGDDGRSYGAATAVTQEITVSAAMQTLMFDLVADGTSGDVIPLRSTAQNAGGNDITAAVGLPAITYTSSDERVAMVRAAGGGGQELLLKAPGTVTITALRGGGTVGGVTYAVAADVTQDIIVESATFTPLANAGQVGDDKLNTTVNSGMEVTLLRQRSDLLVLRSQMGLWQP